MQTTSSKMSIKADNLERWWLGRMENGMRTGEELLEPFICQRLLFLVSGGYNNEFEAELLQSPYAFQSAWNRLWRHNMGGIVTFDLLVRFLGWSPVRILPCVCALRVRLVLNLSLV